MKTPLLTRLALVGALALAASARQAEAQPAITSFSQNGVMVCSNLYPGSVATVEWASSLAGPWQSDWVTLRAVPVTSNGVIQVSVPMFYRVLATSGMAPIPAGSFTMGDTLDGESDAIPTSIYVSAFYMDINLVSYSQWQGIHDWAINSGYSFDNVGSGKAANHPVLIVDWYDCVKWCNARSQLAGLKPCYYTDAALTVLYQTGQLEPFVDWSANGYRLPTEAEWEKAARGGLSGQRFPWGNTISESQANYDACTNCGLTYDLGPYSGYNTNFDTGGQPYTSPVGYFAANGYGLYDMAGNVQEMCWDWYGTPYGQPTATNPTGPAFGTTRVVRGGGWNDNSGCAPRGNIGSNRTRISTGFRCVRGH